MKKKTQKKTKTAKRSIVKRASTLKKFVQKIRSRIAPKSLKKIKIQQSSPVALAAELQSVVYSEPPTNGFQFPERYGEDNLVLMVRDPWWIYAYWEVTPGRENEILQLIQRHNVQPQAKVLRVYDVTDKIFPANNSYFDIEIGYAGNWYVDVGAPDRAWIAEVGFRTSEGRFYGLVRSNVVRTPRFGVSDVLDEEWLLPDELYWKIFGLSGGIASQKSSLDVKEILERYLRGLGASENAPNFKPHSKPENKDARPALSPESLLEKH